MLHTNTQGYWALFGSKEEYFKRVLPYMGRVAILVMYPKTNAIFILFYRMNTQYAI